MNNQFMQEALYEAKKAAEAGEIPVGAVIVQNGEVIARGHNLTVEKDNILAHAEFLVIEEALHKLSKRRLSGCSLYVTLEPCAMCAGAILLARPDRVYFGAYDAAAGACGGKAWMAASNNSVQYVSTLRPGYDVPMLVSWYKLTIASTS